MGTDLTSRTKKGIHGNMEPISAGYKPVQNTSREDLGSFMKAISGASAGSVLSGPTRMHVLVIPPGEDIIAVMLKHVHENNVQAAVVMSAVGVISSVTMRMAHSDKTNPAGFGIRTFRGIHQKYQLAHVGGCISSAGSRLSVVLGDKVGETFSGQVLSNFISYESVEVVLMEVGGVNFYRQPMPQDRDGFAQTSTLRIQPAASPGWAHNLPSTPTSHGS